MIKTTMEVGDATLSYEFDDFQEFMIFFMANWATPEQKISIKDLMVQLYGDGNAQK